MSRTDLPLEVFEAEAANVGTSPAIELREKATPSRPKDDIVQIELHRPQIPTWRLVVIFICIGTGLFLSLMDTTIVSTILYTVSEEFGGFRLSSWIILSYTLSYVGFAVFMARLADVMSRKWVLILSFIIFLAASMACAASTNLNQLIGFRAAQGVGGAGLYSMTMITYPEITPRGMLPALSSIIGMIVALAGISGPVLGGLLTTYSSWRFVFWINGPCAFVPAVVLLFAWPKSFHPVSTTRFRDLDYLGTLLFMVGSVLFVFILNQAAIRVYNWRSVPVILIFIICGISWFALVSWQWVLLWHPKFRLIRPQLPFRLLTNRVMVAGFMSTTLTGFVLLLTIINVPIRAQIVNLDSAIKSGILLLPLMGGTAVGSALGGSASSKKNNTFWTLTLASIFMLVGTALLSTLPGSLEPAAKQWGFETILGLGLGLSLSSMTLLTSVQVQLQDHAVAQGLVAQLRIFGGSIGVATSFIVLNIHIQDALAGVLTPAQLNDFYSSPSAVLGFPVSSQVLVRETYINAFNYNMRICACLSGLCFIVTLFIYERNPRSVADRMMELEEAYARSEAAAVANGEQRDSV